MRIITINVPPTYLKAINELVGTDGLYPSRSELIRVAVRDFLIHEIDAAKELQTFSEQSQQMPSPKRMDNNFIQVPMEDASECLEFKTYRLIKR